MIRNYSCPHNRKEKQPISDVMHVRGWRRWKLQVEIEMGEGPGAGWLKINVDGAFSENTGVGGIGIIIRDHTGSVKLTAWQVIAGATDAEEVEALQSWDRVGSRMDSGACNPRVTLCHDYQVYGDDDSKTSVPLHHSGGQEGSE